MPVYLEIMSRLDEAAARKASDVAKKHFGDASKSIAADFQKAITDGLSSSDAAVRKSAENTEKAFKKSADAAGAVRVEEAKLDDLRSKGAGATAMLTQTERLEKARRGETTAARDTVSALRDLDTAHHTAANSGSLLAGVLQGVAQAGSGTRIGGIAASVEGIGTGALVAVTGVAALGAGVIAVTKGLYDLGATWDDIGDTITGRTGIMGDQLKAVTDSIKQVGSQSAISFGDISNFASGVAQTLHLTGVEATAMTQKLADIQQVTKQVVDTKDLGKAFRLFDITDVNTEIQTLQQLTAASQSTQIPINDLLTSLSNAGKAGKEAGLGLQQTLGMILALEDAGVSFEKAGPGLAIFLRNAAKDGRDANQVLAETVKQIKAFTDAGNDPAATQLASKMFGGKGYIDFLNAIKDGKFDVDNFAAALQKLGATGDVIGEQKKATEDWHESWKKLTNQLSADLGPVADKVFNGINTVLEFSSRNLHTVNDDVKNLATSIDSINPDKLAAAMGLPGLPGAPAPPTPPPMAGTSLGQTPTIPLTPQKDWITGQQRVWDPKTRSYVDPFKQGSGAKQPDAPAVAYDTSLPPGYAGVPQTSEIVGAENSWMDARHTLAEKQARLNQLENDNNAKADDITKAKNDVINAQQAQGQAELRLSDARTTLYTKENKALNDHTAALSEFGAKLDSDLGISKGLSGIADNLVRFVANLAMAPMMGQLSALANAPGQAQGGYGLMGVLGAQGVFGPQYTAAGQAAATNNGTQSAPKAVLNSDGTVGYSSAPGVATGMPYGLAAGTNTGGYGSSGAVFPDWVHQLESSFGVKASTYPGHQESDRHEPGYAPNPQHLNRGIDWSGTPEAMERFAAYVSTLPQAEQVIYSGQRPYEYVAGQQRPGYFASDLPEHANHVHTRQSTALPLPGGAVPDGTANSYAPAGYSSTGSSGGPFPIPLPVTIVGSGAGGGGPIPGLPGSSGAAGSSLWDEVMKHEGGTWNNADTGHNGHFGGLQFSPSTWRAYGGVGNPQDATREQQIDIANRTAFTGYNGTPPQGLGAWEAITKGMVPGVTTSTPAGAFGVGSVAPPSSGQPGYVPGTGYVDSNGNPTGYNPSNLGGPGPLPNIIPGSAGQGFLGLGGPGTGQPQLGGVEPPSNPSGGGFGITSGGTLDTAMSVAASAFPGLGQAAQTGMKLANRAIQFAGQAAGIGVQGALDTFIPWGGSELASKNWITRLAGAAAGAAPALPNMAGKAASKPGQQPGGQGGDGGQTINNNVTYNNNGATEDRAGKDLEHHLTNMYQAPGMP